MVGWLFLPVILMLLTSCVLDNEPTTGQKRLSKELSFAGIKKVTIASAKRRLTLEPGRDTLEIKKIVSSFNAAGRVGTQNGTTHPVTIIVFNKNGEQIIIGGGTQGFQTVRRGRTQYNVQGNQLNTYFKNLLTKFGR